MAWLAGRTREFNEWSGALTETEKRDVAACVETLKETGPTKRFYRQIAKADKIYDAHLRDPMED